MWNRVVVHYCTIFHFWLNLRKLLLKQYDGAGNGRCRCAQRELRVSINYSDGKSNTECMRNSLLKWHCCLTHKTLKRVDDDLTGRLGGRIWVCIWEREGIRPLTQSRKCCCIYSLADSLMFFSQRLADSIFFLVEEWGGQYSQSLVGQGETFCDLLWKQVDSKALQEAQREAVCTMMCFILFIFLNMTIRHRQVERLASKQMVRLSV